MNCAQVVMIEISRLFIVEDRCGNRKMGGLHIAKKQLFEKGKSGQTALSGEIVADEDD